MPSFSPVQLWKQSFDNASFSSILNDADNDRSCSSISQGSNKGFSIKEICPEVSFNSEVKHQRVCSQNLDLLSPQVLFAHMRKGSKVGFHEKKLSVLVPESEEMNSTRMPTSQSRRISEFELANGSSKEIPDLLLEKEEFCKTCQKSVKAVEAPNEKPKLEAFLMSGLSSIFSHLCWCPGWISKFKMKSCEECGNWL